MATRKRQIAVPDTVPVPPISVPQAAPEVDTKHTPEAAMLYLAGRCDFARTRDGHGFSSYDTQFGHDLADSAARYGILSPGRRKWAKILADKYRGQLIEAGFDIETICAAPDIAGHFATRAAVTESQARVTFRASIERDTYKGILLGINGQAIWFPKRQCQFGPHLGNNTYDITVPAWLAREKGLTAGAAA